MKIQFHIQKKQIIESIVIIAAAFLLWLWSGYKIYYLPLFGIIFFLLDGIRLQLSEKLAGLWTTLLFIIGPIFSTYCIQRIILEKELFLKTGKTAWRLNILLVSVVYLLFLALLARAKWAWIAAHCFFLLLAFTDYFVYEFRGNEITFGDITTVGTGLSVLRNYKLQMSGRGAVILLISVLAVVFVWKCDFRYRPRWLIRVTALFLMVIIARSTWQKALGKVTQTWEKKGTYRNGFVLNFLLGTRDNFIDPPTGYSEEVIGELEKLYGPGAGGSSQEAASTEPLSGDRETETENISAAQKAFNEGKKPTVITIMNESFADFRLIGDLQTNIEVTPYIDSLQENITKGFSLVSIFGAKTPNSEWEYMTGNTMAFLPGGSVPYQQYIDEEPFSMVSIFKNMGYTTVAMHPYYSTGWRRNSVYPKLGFDESHFMDTGDFDETRLMRDYITDEAMYDKVIDRYKLRADDEPLFIMGVTMQNHGGYKDTYPNFQNTVMYQYGQYPDADQYLSLIHESDKAVEKLISYFETVDEPVEIVFFGDHYPSLNSAFYKSLNGKGVSGLTLTQLQDLFSVPFFIWTNYDTEEETVERTSLNYLNILVMQKAGIELTPYQKFLRDMREIVPAMNGRGFYSYTNGKFIHYADAKGDERLWLQKYRILQYNSLFDQENHSTVFFPYVSEEAVD